jgi:hypothetical protein
MYCGSAGHSAQSAHGFFKREMGECNFFQRIPSGSVAEVMVMQPSEYGRFLDCARCPQRGRLLRDIPDYAHVRALAVVLAHEPATITQ